MDYGRRAWRDGWTRVSAAPAVAAGVFALTFLLAVPLAMAMRDTLASHLGDSLAAETVATGVNYDWWQEFGAQASGLGTTFTPSVIGFAAVLDNISGILDARPKVTSITWALALYLTGWAFLSGGILDRYARQRPTGTNAFFGACGVYFFRFLRLGTVAGLIYWWLFGYVQPWLLDEQFTNVTRNMSVERTAFIVRALFYAIFGALLAVTNLITDYSKVRIVVEDRYSVLGAIASAVRFVRHHPRQTLGLYGLNTLTFLAVLVVWFVVAPGAGGGWRWALVMFFFAQLYIVVRLLLKLQFMSSQVALFQANLAHASYTSAPVPVWPDSAAAESIQSRSVVG